MKSYYKTLTMILATAGLVQLATAQDKEPQKETMDKEEIKKEAVLGLELGAKLPKLNVTIQNGFEVPLAAATGHRWVFVFFYPKALTGG